MASILSAFSLCVLLCAVAVSSKPAHDLGSSKPSNSADSVLRRVLKLDTVSSSKVESVRDLEVLSLNSEPVPSLTNTGDGLRRVRRQVITGNGCPGDMIWFIRCRTFKSYEQLVQEEDAEE